MTVAVDVRIDDMLRGYMVCAVWVGLDWTAVDRGEQNPDPLDQNYDVDDIGDEARAKIRVDIVDFVEHNRADLDLYAELRSFNPAEGSVWDYAGHDFYLSRNGHGTGFWDRGNDPVFERLHQATKPYGSQELDIDDDGKLYVQ